MKCKYCDFKNINGDYSLLSTLRVDFGILRGADIDLDIKKGGNTASLVDKHHSG